MPLIKPAASADQAILGELLLKPSGMAKLEVGLYPNTTPAPKFEVELDTTKPDMIGVSLEHIEHENNETAFVYYFQNFADSPCHVIVRTAVAQGK